VAKFFVARLEQNSKISVFLFSIFKKHGGERALCNIQLLLYILFLCGTELVSGAPAYLWNRFGRVISSYDLTRYGCTWAGIVEWRNVTAHEFTKSTVSGEKANNEVKTNVFKSSNTEKNIVEKYS
jgi:hypothetical protein